MSNFHHDPVKITFRKKGLPKRLKRIPGGVPGLVAACNVHVAGPEWPCAKVAVFRACKDMRRFYNHILPAYRGVPDVRLDSLGRRCLGFVNKLAIERCDLDTGKVSHIEFDRRFFCFVGLVEGHLTAEILAHEGVHVGFAWDYRTRGKGPFNDSHNEEENVCYPAGIFVDQVFTFIKREKLREV